MNHPASASYCLQVGAAGKIFTLLTATAHGGLDGRYVEWLEK